VWCHSCTASIASCTCAAQQSRHPPTLRFPTAQPNASRIAVIITALHGGAQATSPATPTLLPSSRTEHLRLRSTSYQPLLTTYHLLRPSPVQCEVMFWAAISIVLVLLGGLGWCWVALFGDLRDGAGMPGTPRCTENAPPPPPSLPSSHHDLVATTNPILMATTHSYMLCNASHSAFFRLDPQMYLARTAVMRYGVKWEGGRKLLAMLWVFQQQNCGHCMWGGFHISLETRPQQTAHLLYA
jgi:hypothetical protein